jgi:hypothetical protein
MKNWLIRKFGYGRPLNVYLNARYILRKGCRQDKTHFSTKTFTVRRDLVYVYVLVGYDVVFKCRIKSLDAPEIYKYDSWVGELNDLVKAWQESERRFNVQ